jgi:hypothetical protein
MSTRGRPVAALADGRKEHLEFFAAALEEFAKHVFILKGSMGKKQRRSTAESLASVPETESRVILATGSYIGEGFDDARLDTLFLAMPAAPPPRGQAGRAGV